MNSTINHTASSPKLCENVAELISMATVQLMSFLANLVAAVAIWRLPGLEGNKYHLAVRTLVVSDLVITLSTLPFSIISYANCAWIGGEILCSVTAFISTTFLSWSFLIVFVMCFLRFLAVTRPLFYRSQVTLERVQKALLLGLVWPCLHLILPVTGFGKFRLYSKGLYCALDLSPGKPRGKILLYATVIEGSLVIVALLYFCVTTLCFIKKKRRVSTSLSEQQKRGASTQRVNKQHGGFARMTFVIVVLFCVCYVPFLVSNSVQLIAIVNALGHPNKMFRFSSLERPSFLKGKGKKCFGFIAFSHFSVASPKFFLTHHTYLQVSTCNGVFKHFWNDVFSLL